MHEEDDVQQFLQVLSFRSRRLVHSSAVKLFHLRRQGVGEPTSLLLSRLYSFVYLHPLSIPPSFQHSSPLIADPVVKLESSRLKEILLNGSEYVNKSRNLQNGTGRHLRIRPPSCVRQQGLFRSQLWHEPPGPWSRSTEHARLYKRQWILLAH